MSQRLKTLLEDILTAEENRIVSSSYDMIGDIIILKIPERLLYKKYTIGKKVLENIENVKSVFLQTSPVEGEYRIRKLELLAGDNDTITEYHEHGCRFIVDLSKVYFSPRLSTERLRIAKKIKDNEIVANMFAGVGTFSIVIANVNKTCKVYSIDSNTIANTLSQLNTKLNKLEDRVFTICGDAEHIASTIIAGKSNRVLMPLPEKSKRFVSSAIKALSNKGGTVHYFAHVKADNKKNALDEGMLDTGNAFNSYNHRIDTTRVIREVGPRLYQIVSDVYVNKS
jgi:tRNA (guanine37-N1)-methyltransferase